MNWLGILDAFIPGTQFLANGLGIGSWEDTYESNPVANVWKGFNGQTSADRNADKANATNMAINQANLDYAQHMTQAQWERDDTAHQRQVADLEKAGLSPLAASNGAPNSAVVTDGPMNQGAVAAQTMPTGFNLNSLLDLALQKQHLGFEERKFEAEHEFDIQKENDDLNVAISKIEQTTQQLNLSNKQLKEQMKQFNDTLKFQQDNLSETVTNRKNSEQLKAFSERNSELMSYIKTVLPEGAHPKFYVGQDKFEAFEAAWSKYVDDYGAFLDKWTNDGSFDILKNNPLVNQDVESSVDANVFGVVKGDVKARNSYNADKRFDVDFQKFLSIHDFPIFLGDDWLDHFDDNGNIKGFRYHD